MVGNHDSLQRLDHHVRIVARIAGSHYRFQIDMPFPGDILHRSPFGCTVWKYVEETVMRKHQVPGRFRLSQRVADLLHERIDIGIVQHIEADLEITLGALFGL